MEEVFPVLAGIALGLTFHHIASRVLRILLFVVLGVGFGAAASWVGGELAISWVYLLIDTAQVLGAAALTAGLVTLRRRASYRTRP
jgi:hypothetical protein